MLAVTVLTTLCAGGLGFYLRFLVALCKECKPRITEYWVRLRLTPKENTVVKLQPADKTISRAA
jgi:hypothetical protein